MSLPEENISSQRYGNRLSSTAFDDRRRTDGFEETAQAFLHLHEMESEIEAINKELETRTDYDSEEYYALIERVSVLSEKFYSIEETNYDADIEKTLLGLGFKEKISIVRRATSAVAGE